VIQLSIERTAARRLFKELAGQNNHFLITILVGLDAVEDGAATLNEGLNARWNPQDRKASARRSRDFAQRSLLAWIVDALDTYVKALSREFDDAIPGGLFTRTDSNGKEKQLSLADRLRTLGAHYGVSETTCALVEMGVVWRNRVVHADAANRVNSRVKTTLLSSSDFISSEFQNLDITTTLTNVSDSKSPSLKEVTALVRVAHHYVEAIDSGVLKSVSADAALLKLLVKEIGSDRAGAKKTIEGIWGNEASKTSKAIASFAKSRGGFNQNEQSTNRTSLNFIGDLAKLSRLDAFDKFFKVN